MADDKKPTAHKAEAKKKEPTPLEKANEVGFLGTEVDPTPNEHYTVAGVTKGLPTPETDKGAKAEAVSRIEELSEAGNVKPADD